MADDRVESILLCGFSPEDQRAAASALGAAGRTARAGDPVNDPDAAYVMAAAYDEATLRSFRAAALDDDRPWAFCVPADDRALVSAASAAREGRLCLLPPEPRELKRLLSAMAQDARDLSSGCSAFSGLRRMEAELSWRSSELEVSLVCRTLARLLFQAGFYPGRGAEDECALSLEEALVNSLEHGNLELDSSLRPDDPTDEDRYESERERRLADPAYGGRKLAVSLSISGDEARLSLEDEGPGFDVSALDEGPSGLDVSGKGMWLIRRAFDGAAYNEKGNRLTLTRLRPRGR